MSGLSSELRVGSVCTGTGALELAVQSVLPARLTWYSEIDPAARLVLEHHYPDVPNHGDLTVADWSTAAAIDLFTAGWPCQPWSLAGKRKGALDERAIWPHVARAIRHLRPRIVLLENVPAIIAAGELGRAVTDLASYRYVGRWVCVRASDAGAPHKRERVFILATHPEGIGPERPRIARPGGGGSAHHDLAPSDAQGVGRGEGRTQSAGLVRGPHAALGGDPTTADPGGAGRRPGSGLGGRAGSTAIGVGAPSPAHADRDGLECLPELDGRATQAGSATPESGGHADGRPGPADWREYGPAIKRWETILGRPAPAPTMAGARGGPALSHHFTEWLMGLPQGWITDVPGIDRRKGVRLCGNGVVPAQAAVALSWLLASTAERAA